MPTADQTCDDMPRRTDRQWRFRMRPSVSGSPSATRRRSISWSSGIRAAPIAWRGRSCATPRRRVTPPRRPSSVSSSRRAASADAPGSRRGSTGCSSTSAWISAGKRGGLAVHPVRHRLGGDGAGRPGEESVESPLDRQPAPSIDPLDGMNKERDAERLWTAVGTLSPQQRAVVILQGQEELSTKEIATILKCSEATVRVHLHRALMTLRRTMGNE